MGTHGNAVITNLHHPDTNASLGKMPWNFIALTFGLAIPFWMIDGDNKLPLPGDLPIAALVAFTPAIAASITAYRSSGAKGVRELWKRALDYRKIRNKTWYLPMLFLMPTIYVLSYTAMWLTGMSLPDHVEIPLIEIPILTILYFPPGVGEELAWMGYAFDPMQNRWGALKASFIFWAMYTSWHFIPFVLTGNSASWIMWQSLAALPSRILYVWLYNNTGKSVFSAAMFHSIENVSWSLFPNHTSHYSPFVTCVVTAAIAAIVVYGWGAKTLARFRFGKRGSTKVGELSTATEIMMKDPR